MYELEVVTEERNRVRRDYDDLRRLRLEAFMSGFGIISLKLKEMYQMITLGGDAELELLGEFAIPKFVVIVKLVLFDRLVGSILGRNCFQRAAPKEELEKHLKPVRWRENTVIFGIGVRFAPLQAHAPLCYGRD